MALRILIESLWALVGNIGQAARVSVFPFAVVVLAAFALSFFPVTRDFFQGNAIGPNVGVLGMILAFVLLPLSAIVVAWVAVSWHRLVLREIEPGLLPAEKGRKLLPYAGQSLLIWLLTLAVVFAGVFIIGLSVAATFDVAATDRLRGVLFSLGFVGFTYLWLRWGIALVGTAVEKPMRMRDAWRATRASRGTVLGVSVFIVVINRIAETLITAFGHIPLPVDVLASAALVWITALMGISALTTLYGYCVEGRH